MKPPPILVTFVCGIKGFVWIVSHTAYIFKMLKKGFAVRLNWHTASLNTMFYYHFQLLLVYGKTYVCFQKPLVYVKCVQLSLYDSLRP